MAQAPDHVVQKQWESQVAGMVAQGQSCDQILVELMAANWPQPRARELIRRAVSKQRTKAITMIVACGLLALVATIVTIATVSQAMSQGGEYFVWYGGIIGGVWGLIVGIVKLTRIRA